VIKKKRHTPAEIATKLERADALSAEGRAQSDIAQALGISVMTFHRWRKARPQILRSENNSAPEAIPLVPIANLLKPQQRAGIAELQLENTRLRRLVTDLLLEKMQLEENAPQFRGRAISAKK
jgi:hypothetical protein